MCLSATKCTTQPPTPHTTTHLAHTHTAHSHSTKDFSEVGTPGNAGPNDGSHTEQDTAANTEAGAKLYSIHPHTMCHIGVRAPQRGPT